MKIYNSFAEIADQFDALLVDAYGVFWDGGSFYDGSRETMATAVKQGKPVCVLSNTTALQPDAVESYRKRGLELGRDYTEMVTSGDAAREILLNGGLAINGHKIYLWGNPRGKLFADTPYCLVDDPTDADAFYISIPQLNEQQKQSWAADGYIFYCSRLNGEGRSEWWDSMSVEPFVPSLKELVRLGLPAICANPDYRAFERPRNETMAYPVVRQGLIAETFRKLGGRVLEFGKPHPEIFNYAFRKLGIAPSCRVAMIGDTYRTDIVGALNAGVTPVWCVETGMAKYETDKGKTLVQLCGGDWANIYMIRSFGGCPGE